MMFRYLSSSMIIILLATLFVSAVTSEAFATFTTTRTTTATTTPISNPPSFLSTSTSRANCNDNNINNNNNNNNMLFSARRRGTPSSSSSSSSSSRLNLIYNKIPYGGRGGGVVVKKTTSKTSSKTSTSLFTEASGDDSADKCPFTKSMAIFGSVWGSFGVIYILAKAIMRVAPIAYEPFMSMSSGVVATGSSSLPSFSAIQWSLYTISCIFFAYAEGYKGFHLKFAPLVVKRSFTLVIGTKQGNNPINYLFAPLYSMGLFYATRKRLIISWCVSIGVGIIVGIVKKLPPTSRCILDAGVVVGLSIGSLSILYHFIKSIVTGKLPNIDPCLPPLTTSTKTN